MNKISYNPTQSDSTIRHLPENNRNPILNYTLCCRNGFTVNIIGK